MKRSFGIWLGGALAVTSLSAVAQTSPAIIKQSFEESDGGWMSVGMGGTVSVTHDAANVKSGKAALQFDYSIKKGDVSALLYPTLDGVLAKAKSMRFWVKADTGAVLAAALQEADGGRYIAMFTVPAGKWQQVELATSDFLLSEDANDPPDPDGKLDLDKVENIALTDVGQILAQAENADLKRIFNLKRGAHTLYVDDFTVTEEALPALLSSEFGTVLDSFMRPQVGWFAIGDMKVASTSGAPLSGRGIQLDYHQSFGKFVGVIRKIPRTALVGKNTLSLDIASTRPAKLLIQVEEKTGGKYNVMVDVAGGKALKTLTIPFADLKAADDSKDNNDKLDLDQVNQVLVLDVNALLNMTDGDNTLWIGSVRAITAKIDK